MTKNVGSIDKTVRIVAGLVLIALAIMDVGAPWTWIGILPLVTGLMGTCPAYTLFKIDTCPKD
tara:strand:- start:1696 stop:1884 length:189 start_codon:yes stop_codon:yes gene_type:complete